MIYSQLFSRSLKHNLVVTSHPQWSQTFNDLSFNSFSSRSKTLPNKIQIPKYPIIKRPSNLTDLLCTFPHFGWKKKKPEIYCTEPRLRGNSRTDPWAETIIMIDSILAGNFFLIQRTLEKPDTFFFFFFFTEKYKITENDIHFVRNVVSSGDRLKAKSINYRFLLLKLLS